MNQDTVDSAAGRIEPEPGDAQTQLSAALEHLLDRDNRWLVIPAHGVMTVTRGWPDDSTVTLVIVSPQTGYAVREDPSGHKTWAVRGTVQQLTAAALEFDYHAASAPSEPPSEFRRDDRA